MRIHLLPRFDKRAVFNRPSKFKQLRQLLFNAVTPMAAAAAFVSTALMNAAVPAFPGAQGGGAASVGGRGGVVIEVTNLDDNAPGTAVIPGSLRAAVEASGARTVVFRVGGTIHLKYDLRITNPYLTVAGQTAPGGGILLSGKYAMDANPSKSTTPAGTMVLILTHDVIWRYTRIRWGYQQGADPKDPANAGINPEWGVCFSAEDGSFNVIADHNSISWNQDDSMCAWRRSDQPVNHITFSQNIVAEGLLGHSTGFISGAKTDALADGVTDIDFHRNLTMNNTHRNPLLRNKSSRIVNNIFYNLKNHSTHLARGVSADIIGNLYKQGPLNSNPSFYHEVKVHDSPELRADGSRSHSGAPGEPSIYLAGNIGWHQTNPAGDQWLLGNENTYDNGSDIPNTPIRPAWRRTPHRPLPNTTYPIVAEPVAQLENSIVPTVGASQRLDASGNWVANRDSVDTRLVTQYQTNTGNSVIIKKEDEVGGFPTIAPGTAYTDTDHDGMPDAWEKARGLDPNVADNNGDDDGDGYTNLEEFLNGPMVTTAAAIKVTGRKPEKSSDARAAFPTSARALETPRPLPRREDLGREPRPNNNYGSLGESLQALRARRPLDLNAAEWRRQHPAALYAEWARQAQALLAEGLHYDTGKLALNAVTTARWETDAFVRETIEFNTTPWFRVPGYFYVPKNVPLPAPALVVFHEWGGPMLFGADRISGEPLHPAIAEHRRKTTDGRALADWFASQGYAVIVIDAYHFGRRAPRGVPGLPSSYDATTLDSETLKRYDAVVRDALYLGVRQLNWAGTTWAGVNYGDDSRCVDYLLSRKEVDPERIGCTGLSGGGWRTNIMAALEPRIKAAVSVGWMTTGDAQQSYNVAGAIGSFCLLPGVWNRIDIPDLIAMAAPKAVMVVSGAKDTLFPPLGQRDAARQIADAYAWAGYAGRFRDYAPDKEHCYDAEIQGEALAWFDTHLKNRRSATTGKSGRTQ